MNIIKEESKKYQLLFDHMINEHGLTLTDTEMDAIIDKSDEVKKQFEDNFTKYRRTAIAEMRPVTKEEIELGRLITTYTPSRKAVSVSMPDLENGSPKEGDMIARNPKNHEDQWLVAEQYFKDNFAPYNE